jgi:hypothetical protein
MVAFRGGVNPKKGELATIIMHIYDTWFKEQRTFMLAMGVVLVQ